MKTSQLSSPCCTSKLMLRSETVTHHGSEKCYLSWVSVLVGVLTSGIASVAVGNRLAR